MGATRTVVRGLAALAVLAVLTIGLPWLLLRISGSPIPDTIPNWNQIWTALTSRDDGTLLLGLLKYAAWAGWALFAASLAADLVARVRGISVPRLGPQQQLASGLVSAVVAIAVGIPTVGTTAAAAAPPQGPRQTISTTAVVDAPAARLRRSRGGPHSPAPPRPLRSAAAQTDHQASQFAPYTVRRGDCLWDIAWNELGDPERWPELWHASRHLRQPGGHRITDPDHIEPGWTILIPATRTSASRRPRAAARSHALPAERHPRSPHRWTLPPRRPQTTVGAGPPSRRP